MSRVAIGGVEKPASPALLSQALASVKSDFVLDQPLTLPTGPSASDDYAHTLYLPRTPAPPTPKPNPEMERLTDMTYWWSIQNSQFASDFKDYIAKFPNGEYRSLAERRLASLTTPPPLSMPTCPTSQDAILQPVRNLYFAMNTINYGLFLGQIMRNGVYRSHDGRVEFEITDSPQGRQEWNNRARTEARQLGYRASIEPNGTALVRDSHFIDITYYDGRRTQNVYYEDYKLGCSTAGTWAIVEVVDYSH